MYAIYLLNVIVKKLISSTNGTLVSMSFARYSLDRFRCTIGQFDILYGISCRKYSNQGRTWQYRAACLYATACDS